MTSELISAIKKPFIPLILGTARDGRRSETVAKYIYEIISDSAVESQFIDPKDFLRQPKTIPSWAENDDALAWREIAERADGFIIVVPEYNHSYPGELKLLLDQAYKQYFSKPVGVVSVSVGEFGGVRAVESLLPVLHALNMHISANHVYISNVEKLFANHKAYFASLYQEKIINMKKDLIRHCFFNSQIEKQ